MIKNISFKELLFKSDHTGKRVPTRFAWSLVVLFIFGSFFMSKEKPKKLKHEARQDIIKEREIIEASNSHSKEEEKSAVDLSEEIDFPIKADSVKPKRISGKVDAKMIVFDATNNYQSDQIAPLGSMIECLLIHNIVTNNFSAPVIAQVWEDFYFDGKLLLPFGTRIFGTARAGKERDRVLVTFHTIVYQDGREVPIKALGLSADGSAGLTGILVSKQNKKRVLMLAMNFMSGIALGLQEKATNAVTGLREITTDSRNAVLQGASNTFEKEAGQLEKEINAAEGYAIVVAGNKLIVYFEKSVDVEPL
ncbi:MAG: hypothetical protein KBD53_08590 [Candidatus Omnitrophica bacterium]|nr:hypothetical protein [Candidatus Omnitrophota bacterium]